jgi:hypothetical protein
VPSIAGDKARFTGRIGGEFEPGPVNDRLSGCPELFVNLEPSVVLLSTTDDIAASDWAGEADGCFFHAVRSRGHLAEPVAACRKKA